MKHRIKIFCACIGIFIILSLMLFVVMMIAIHQKVDTTAIVLPLFALSLLSNIGVYILLAMYFAIINSQHD